MASHVKTLKKFSAKRADAAAAMSAAIENLDLAFQKFHEANDSLKITYPDPLPINVLTGGGEVEAALRNEIWRLAGRPSLLGGQRGGIPSLPGGAPESLSIVPSQTRSLAEKVADANARLLAKLEGEPTAAGLEDLLPPQGSA